MRFGLIYVQHAASAGCEMLKVLLGWENVPKSLSRGSSSTDELPPF